jgi:pyruvate/2-oxoglutarate dehydrogenase complex dihydrolipoamide acyltransferase (E2) component
MPDASCRGVILKCWQELDQAAVDARVLGVIQERLADEFDEVYSPAVIARILADEGAELHHPEVIESDAQWRQQQIKLHSSTPSEEAVAIADDQLTLASAEQLIEKLEQLRSRAEASSVQHLRDIAIEARERAQILAKQQTPAQRAEQLEIAEWLGVWIKTPTLFHDWLELRKRSEDFTRKFSERE